MRKSGECEKAVYYFSAALMLDPGYEKARQNLNETIRFMARGDCREGRKGVEDRSS